MNGSKSKGLIWLFLGHLIHVYVSVEKYIEKENKLHIFLDFA